MKNTKKSLASQRCVSGIERSFAGRQYIRMVHR